MCEDDWGTAIARIPSRYICLSRLPVLRAMLQDGMSLKALMSAKNHLVLRARTVANTFASLGFDPIMVASLAKRHGVDPVGFFHDGLLHAPPFLNLLNDRQLTREARRIGHAAANLVRDYLRQEGMFDYRRVGLVDIGWGGTIQDQLRDCIMDEADCPTLYGYYFGGNRSLFDRRTPENWMAAVVASTFSPDHELPLGNAATFSFVGLMEELARASHGTCVGYARSGNDIVPVLRPDKERVAECRAEPVLCRIQAGAIDYAREYAAAVELFDTGPAEMRSLANTALQRIVFFPEPQEVELWQTVHHTNDVGGVLEIDEVLVTPPAPRWRRPWRWRKRSRASMWTFGSIRYLLGLPGLILYNVGWSASKCRNVQAPMNQQRFAAPYYFSNESRRSPEREPAKLAESRLFLDAAARADAHVVAVHEQDVDEVQLISPAAAIGTACVLKLNRILPRRVYAGFQVVNDGLPLADVVNRSIKRPLQDQGRRVVARGRQWKAVARRSAALGRGRS
jgi:hypothetical protein